MGEAEDQKGENQEPMWCGWVYAVDLESKRKNTVLGETEAPVMAIDFPVWRGAETKTRDFVQTYVMCVRIKTKSGTSKYEGQEEGPRAECIRTPRAVR